MGHLKGNSWEVLEGFRIWGLGLRAFTAGSEGADSWNFNFPQLTCGSPIVAPFMNSMLQITEVSGQDAHKKAHVGEAEECLLAPSCLVSG